MANDIFQVQSKDAVVRLNHYNALNALQNFNWEPRFNEEYVRELGNRTNVAQFITPEISASFEMTSTGASVALLKKLMVVKTAGEFSGYKAGTAAAPVNTGTVRTLDLEMCVADLIEAKKPNEVFSRATLLPRMFLSSISMKAQANGTSSETYSFDGDIARIFPTGKQDLVSVPCTRKVGSLATVCVIEAAFKDFAVAPGTTETYIIHQLMVDDIIIPSGSFTVDKTTGEITPTGAYAGTLAQGQRINALLYRRTPGAFPVIEYPRTARFVKGHQTDIFLVQKATVDISAMADGALNAYAFTTAQKFLRAQSMDANIDLRREALRQIQMNANGSPIFARVVTYPLNVTASISVLESTMDDHANLTGKVAATDILTVADFENVQWQVVRRDYLNGVAIQTFAITDARVSGRGSRISNGGRAEISWSFTGSDVMWDAA